MRTCLRCDHDLDHRSWKCAACGFEPDALEGYTSFAPSRLAAESAFDSKSYETLAALEAGNFWFRARNKLILYVMKQYCPDARHIMEIGCGTGFVLGGVARDFPGAQLTGTEIHAKPLHIAQARAPQATLLQLDATALPFRSEFDAIGAFDVLEHIEQDELVLRQMHRAMRPGGSLILTVPQHPFLWSEHDEQAHHVRRYQADELRRKVTAAGFQIDRMTSFVSLLLPAMMLSRLKHRKRTLEACHSEFSISRTLNAALEVLMDAERALIRLGLNFPAGGSLLLAARRP